MKKLSAEEFNQLMFAPKGARVNEIVQKILLLGINEAMVISDTEWTLKQKPGQYFYQNQDKFNGMLFKARKLADGYGWGIQRVS